MIIIGMLCITAIITVIALAGAAEVLGQIASAAFLTWATTVYLRIRRGNT